MQILGFSPRVYEGVSEFFATHPVTEIKVRRAADMASPCVPIGSGVCQKCGFYWRADKLFVDTLADAIKGLGEEMPRGTLPSDFLEAIEVTHAWDQASRSRYCGGRLVLSSEG